MFQTPMCCTATQYVLPTDFIFQFDRRPYLATGCGGLATAGTSCKAAISASLIRRTLAYDPKCTLRAALIDRQIPQS